MNSKGRIQAVGPPRGVLGQRHQSQEHLCLCPRTRRRGPAPCLRPFGVLFNANKTQGLTGMDTGPANRRAEQPTLTSAIRRRTSPCTISASIGKRNDVKSQSNCLPRKDVA
ncbi:hypothetical protein Y032_0026g1433 [Ancylostoma ceylanicum]|uniref:Uncharacterized protein n=1 Tax=Ancylostoma ceylanicum TaxID=53326 RepID=A0A016UWN9_9BILA|nr:hypothetical protein Y032_0026g1433 [Ancylostoma ceylanicum]